MTIKLIGINHETGAGAIEARNGDSTALIDFRINYDGSVRKGWVKYSIKASQLANFQADVKELDVEAAVKTFPDYWVFTKQVVAL